MRNRRWFYPVWALAACWLWAFHVATGFLNSLIAAKSGARSGIVGMLNSVTDALLVEPFGRNVTVLLLIVVGAGLAALIYRMKRE